MHPKHVNLPKAYYERIVAIGADGEDAARAAAFGAIVNDLITSHHGDLGLHESFAADLATEGFREHCGIRHEAYSELTTVDGAPCVRVRARAIMGSEAV